MCSRSVTVKSMYMYVATVNSLVSTWFNPFHTPSFATDAFSSVLAADLQGLDLNPAPSQPQQLTSIQELLLNERLVINRSTWIDSQILELEGRTEDVSQHPPSSSPSTLSSPRRENSVEQQLLQLGLDVSKTTIVSSSQQNELSLSARTVLGQLPELTFMLSDCIIEV